MSSVVEQMVALRRAVLRRYPEYDVEGEEAARALAQEAEIAVANPDEVRVLEGRAVVALWTAKTKLGWVAQRGRIEVAVGDAGAVEWVGAELARLRPRLDASLELLLDTAHAEVLPRAEAAGLRSRLVLLHGAPVRALQGLRGGGLDRGALGELVIAPLEPEHIEAVVTLFREVFSEQPELGMLPPAMVVTPELQQQLDQFMREFQGACAEAGTAFVVLREGEVVGHGSAQARPDPLLGLAGGVSIALRPALRGRGVGKLLYERLLERLVAGGVKVVRGRTANPAVLHLAERMGRPLRGWQLEVGPV